MPELPEVETVVRDLQAQGIEGRTIQKAHVHWQRIIKCPSRSAFLCSVKHQVITKISRRGKFIVMALGPEKNLLVHLRMTGRLVYQREAYRPARHLHLIMEFDNQWTLNYIDPRKFGRWYLVADPATVLGTLGPEPLDGNLTGRKFRKRLERHSRMLKPLLLDQRFLAGLGNIYVDEALWAAKLHPRRSSASLTAKEAHKLYASIRRVLRKGIAARGTSLGRASTNFRSLSGNRGRHQEKLNVFRRTGMPCPRCAGPIKRLLVGQRSTHICAQCQQLKDK